MKQRNLIFTTLLAGSLATAGFVTISHAGPQYCDHHGMHSERMGHAESRRDSLTYLMDQANPTDDQKTAIRTIIETSRNDTESVRQQLRENRKAIHGFAFRSDYSLERLRELADQQARLKAELTVARIDAMHRALQVLTPEQQAELAKSREQRLERKKAWMDEHKND